MEVVSCYVSPRPTIVHFGDLLQRLEDYIRDLEDRSRVIIAGDFNAWSAALGD